ncbi:MAG: type II toxin-antitoxin system VapC family toxin [Micromonosporaceae bacterium]
MIVVDAGPLYAYMDRGDKHHVSCLNLIENYPGALIVPSLVISEAAYFLGKMRGPEAELRLATDLGSGAFIVDPVPPADWRRIAQLVARYRDLPLGIVDASVIACAERRGVTTIATVDRRDFSVVRPRHVEAFELLP